MRRTRASTRCTASWSLRSQPVSSVSAPSDSPPRSSPPSDERHGASSDVTAWRSSVARPTTMASSVAAPAGSARRAPPGTARSPAMHEEVHQARALEAAEQQLQRIGLHRLPDRDARTGSSPRPRRARPSRQPSARRCTRRADARGGSAAAAMKSRTTERGPTGRKSRRKCPESDAPEHEQRCRRRPAVHIAAKCQAIAVATPGSPWRASEASTSPPSVAHSGKRKPKIGLAL